MTGPTGAHTLSHTTYLKECQHCGKEFETVDLRNRMCSNLCRKQRQAVSQRKHYKKYAPYPVEHSSVREKPSVMDDQNSPIIELREQVKSQQARIVALSTQFNALLKVLKDNA